MQNLTYQVIKCKRKTIALIIERDNSLVIRSPLEATDEKIQKFFEKKKVWVYTKLAEKEYFQNNLPNAKQYVNGEGFLYLGRSYKLKLVKAKNTSLKFIDNTFQLNENLKEKGKELFVEWYKARSEERMETIAKKVSKQSSLLYRTVKIQDLVYRRGSCTADNILIFNWKTILAPLPVVEYIVLHEMLHIVEKKHSPKFWNLVRGIMPQYEKHKNRLKRYGNGLSL